eukprot:Awhi_evm1s6235
MEMLKRELSEAEKLNSRFLVCDVHFEERCFNVSEKGIKKLLRDADVFPTLHLGYDSCTVMDEAQKRNTFDRNHRTQPRKKRRKEEDEGMRVEDACPEELKLKTLCDLKEKIEKVCYDQWVLKMSEEEILQLTENLEELKVTISYTTESYSASDGCRETKLKSLKSFNICSIKDLNNLFIIHGKPEKVV